MQQNRRLVAKSGDALKSNLECKYFGYNVVRGIRRCGLNENNKKEGFKL